MPEAEANNAPRSRAFAIRMVAALVVIALVGLAAFMLTGSAQRPRAALIGGDFALKDGGGKTVSDQTLQGKAVSRLFRIYPLPRRLPDRACAHLRHS